MNITFADLEIGDWFESTQIIYMKINQSAGIVIHKKEECFNIELGHVSIFDSNFEIKYCTRIDFNKKYCLPRFFLLLNKSCAATGIKLSGRKLNSIPYNKIFELNGSILFSTCFGMYVIRKFEYETNPDIVTGKTIPISMLSELIVEREPAIIHQISIPEVYFING